MPIRPDATPTARRSRARELLARFDLDAIAAWAEADAAASRALQSLLFDDDDLVGWRSVEALGRVAAVRAGRDPGVVRELLRQTLWLMNDESGGLMWHGPHVLGAVLANVASLCDEFAPLLASFLEEVPFREATRWALWRVADVRPDVAAAAAAELTASLVDAEPAVRGLSALALRAGGAAVPPELSGDGATFALFDHRTGELRTVSVAEAARGAPPR